MVSGEQEKIDALAAQCLAMTDAVQAKTCAHELYVMRHQADNSGWYALCIAGAILLVIVVAVTAGHAAEIRRWWWALRDEARERREAEAKRDGCKACGRPPLAEPAGEHVGGYRGEVRRG